MKEIQLTVPPLRFPEFKNDWVEHKGNTLFTNSRAKGVAGLPIYSVTLNNGLVPRDTLERRLEGDAATEDNLRADAGDLVYNMMRMWQGAVGLADVDCMVSPAYIVLRPKENTDSKFFDYNFKRARPLYDLWAYSYGLTNDRLRLYFKDFSKIKFWVPSKKEEQRKIAVFLTSVDEKLNKLRRKHELLETYKRGLMQKIFSQEIRFKQDDGSDFPDWEEKPLSSISDPVKRTTDNPNYPVMTISAGKGFLDQKERFNQVIAGSSLDKYTLIEKDEFAYNRGASKAYPYGCVYLMTEHKAALIPFVYRTFKLSSGVPNFFLQYFIGGGLDRQLRRLISSSARMDGLLNIGEKDFYSVKVPFPHVDEQEKIAVFLQGVDLKADMVAGKIKHLEVFKKALLQQMFV